MFYIDGISLNKIKNELKSDLVNKKINKINKNSETEITIHFGKTTLLFSCNPTFPICYITDKKESNVGNVSNLVASIKKHLMNATLTDITQLGYDRILVFHLNRLNELGELKKYKIYFEIMGKYSNFIVTDENNIIVNVLKRFSLEENRLRPIFPGLPYEQPIVVEKISPTNIDEKYFNELKNENQLVEKIEGIGKLLAKNLTNYEKFQNILNAPSNPKLFLDKNQSIFATVLDIVPNLKYDKIEDFESYSKLVDYYIESNNLSNTFNSLKKRLLKTVATRLKKDDRILLSLHKELFEKQDYEKYKELGDIIASNMYQLKKGMKSIEMFDFYNNKNIVLELDPEKTPNQILDGYYKKYNKLKRGIENNIRRNKEINEEVEYLNGVKVFIDNSDNLDNLNLIYEELIKFHYMKNPKQKRNKKIKEIGYGVMEYDDAIIYYGRNNIENDSLSFKFANKDDVWMHAKNIPGSHIIIKCEHLTDDILLKGAMVAAYYSKANIGDSVSVDYTLRKYLNKPRGAKYGFVTYTHEKNIVVIKPNKI